MKALTRFLLSVLATLALFFASVWLMGDPMPVDLQDSDAAYPEGQP